MSHETIEADAVYFPVRTPAEAQEALGGHARVEGTAVAGRNAPSVRCGEITVECLDIPMWPDDVRGEIVVVRGRLEQGEEGYVMRSPLYEVKGP